MGLFSHKCPRCGGKLRATGHAAPYPSHRCERCIADSRKDTRIQELEARVTALEKTES